MKLWFDGENNMKRSSSLKYIFLILLLLPSCSFYDSFLFDRTFSVNAYKPIPEIIFGLEYDINPDFISDFFYDDTLREAAIKVTNFPNQEYSIKLTSNIDETYEYREDDNLEYYCRTDDHEPPNKYIVFPFNLTAFNSSEKYTIHLFYDKSNIEETIISFSPEHYSSIVNNSNYYDPFQIHHTLRFKKGDILYIGGKTNYKDKMIKIILYRNTSDDVTTLLFTPIIGYFTKTNSEGFYFKNIKISTKTIPGYYAYATQIANEEPNFETFNSRYNVIEP
jgi:hypothetical protein